MKKSVTSIKIYPHIIALVIIIIIVSFYSYFYEKHRLSNNVIGFKFSQTNDVILKQGDVSIGRYLQVFLRDKDAFNATEVELCSWDENVATIELDIEKPGGYLFYKITAVGVGETYVCANAKYNSRCSALIKVVVNDYYSMSGTMYNYDYHAAKSYMLKLISVTSPCINGSKATAKICGIPNATYYIKISYRPTGIHTTKLEPKTSDANGIITWTWDIPKDTIEGNHNIIVAGDSGELISFSFETYQG
ncbi:MAG: hypothetical protein GX628_05245 [Clostridiales bacterium]|nr:hypothetical protein [Clostridiales bacterium]